MRIPLFGFLSLCLLLSLCFGDAAEATETYPLKLTDGRGDTVLLERLPQRIVSLAPSVTELLVELGVEERLVGVTRHCELPGGESITRLEVFPDVSVEALLALDADLVIGADITSPATAMRLRDFGVPLLVVPGFGLDALQSDFLLVGKAVGAGKRAAALADSLVAARSSVAASVQANLAERPKVVMALGVDNAYFVGESVYADGLLREAGGRNIGAQSGAAWPQLSKEFLLREQPEILFISSELEVGELSRLSAERIESLQKHPFWKHIEAVQKGQVVEVNAGYFSIPGPRVEQLLLDLHRWIIRFGKT